MKRKKIHIPRYAHPKLYTYIFIYNITYMYLVYVYCICIYKGKIRKWNKKKSKKNINSTVIDWFKYICAMGRQEINRFIQKLLVFYDL